MRNFLLAVLTSSCFFISACNDSDNTNNNTPTPDPKPPTSNCKIHCAP